jgi:hypothetical protein
MIACRVKVLSDEEETARRDCGRDGVAEIVDTL